MRLNSLIIFGAGAVVGAVGMKCYMDRKYAVWHEETFEDVHIEVVDNPEDVVVIDDDVPFDETDEEIVVENLEYKSSENDMLKNEFIKERKNYSSIGKIYSGTETKPVGDDVVTVKEIFNKPDEEPYFINDMDFNEYADGEYDKQSLDFFLDNEVVVDNGDVIDNPEELLGEANMDRMLTINSEAVYIRNENTMTDYEVILIADKY